MHPKIQEEICVSIFMLTYNQEQYISQAIEGVLMQETDFRFQLVIGEDCSSDKTREICIAYAEKYPEKIKLLLNKRNLGIGPNFVRTYRECRGRYVAICDGDDYWTDPLKLQKQVDFLEKYSQYSIVYTNNINLFPSGEFSKSKGENRPLISGFKELVQGNFIPSVTSIFKKRPLPSSMESWMSRLPYGDWPTYLLAISRGGKIHYLDEITAVYRKDFGTSTALRRNRSHIGEINLRILKNLLKEEDFISQLKFIKAAGENLQIGLMASYLKENNIRKSLRYYFQLLMMSNPLRITRLYLYTIKRTYNKNV